MSDRRGASVCSVGSCLNLGVECCCEMQFCVQHFSEHRTRDHHHPKFKKWEDPPEGRKDDDGKTRWDLLPWAGIEQVAKVLTFGAKKYAPDNWRHVEGWRWRYFRAAVGHAVMWWKGEKLDPESGLPHLAHAACCVLFLLELDR